MNGIEALKLLTAFVTPLGFALLLALLGLLLGRRWLVLLALAWLWLWSTPWAAQKLAATLEQGYPLRSAAESPTADVILVLGGGLHPGAPHWHPEHNLNGSADRILLGEKLLRLQKAPVLLYSGGPGGSDGISEAKAAAGMMVEAGLPAAALRVETNSRTTRENAEFSLPMLQKLGAKRVLLVTSVWHMQRSLETFRAAGREAGIALEYLPVACDPIELSEVPLGIMQFTPNTDALDASRKLFKEWLGLLQLRAKAAVTK